MKEKEEKKFEEKKEEKKFSGPNRGSKYRKFKRESAKKSASGSKEVPDHNDVSLYAVDDNIARDIASQPFNYMGGTKFPIRLRYVTPVDTQGTVNEQVPLPAVAVIDYFASVGVNNYKTDGINMAAAQAYSYVRMHNSGARNYEAADLMMNILALRDIYIEIGECKRAIGLTNLYNYYNHNLPDLIIKAAGFDPVDLRSNLANYRAQLNLLIEKINTFAVPKYFKAFERSALVANTILGDSDSIRGQIYVMHKNGYYTWSTNTSTQGTELVYHAHTAATDTMAIRLAAIKAQIDALYLDEDALTISGDVIKAFGESGLYQLASVDSDYKVVPYFDEDMLAQIENMTIFSALTTDNADGTYTDLNIVQDGQLIKWNPKCTATVGSSSVRVNFENRAFNSHKAEPTYKDVLEWSRLMCSWENTYAQIGSTTNYTLTCALTSSGLELPTSVKVYQYDKDGQVFFRRVPQMVNLATFASDIASNISAMLGISDIQQFDWHHLIYFYNHGTDQDVHISGDLKVPTTISQESIKAMNDAAMYSLFYGRGLY